MSTRLEQARAALAASLTTALAGVATVERNRDTPTDFRTLPRQVVVHDGVWTVDRRNGVAEYELQLTVEGYVAVNDPDDIGPACDALYATMLATALADPQLGGVTYDVTEGGEEPGAIEVLREVERGLVALVRLPLVIRLLTAELDPAVAA